MSNVSADTITNQSLTTSNDDEVNLVYNVFSAEMMKTYKNVIVSLNRNFRRRKQANFAEWSEASRVVELCKKNGFNLKCYVKYCFLNRLVPHGRGRTVRDISFLTHYQQIADYGNQQQRIEKLYKIYINILKSIIRIKNFHNQSGQSISTIMKDIISSGKLIDYIMTGVLSRHFLVLIPNITNMIHEYSLGNRNTDISVINDFQRTIASYGKDAMESMRMFYPTALGKSVVQLCSEK